MSSDNTRANTSGALALHRVHQLVEGMRQGYYDQADLVEQSLGRTSPEKAFQDGYRHAKGIGAIVMTIQSTVSLHAHFSTLRAPTMAACELVLAVDAALPIPNLMRKQADLLEPVVDYLFKLHEEARDVALKELGSGESVSDDDFKNLLG